MTDTDTESMFDNLAHGNMMDVQINKELDHYVVMWDKEKPERTGVHLSNVTSAPFDGVNQLCYREMVFAKKYHPIADEQLPARVLRIFLEGWVIHVKWQDLYKKYGDAIEIEHTRYSKEYDIFYTPDLIAKHTKLTGDDKWIVEIKSMGEKAYDAVKDEYDPYKIHPSGYKQSQMYMYLVGCTRAMLLLENKNTQAHREVTFEYDANFCKPYIDRLDKILVFSKLYDQDKGIPKRVCPHDMTNRAQSCNYRHVCWINKAGREQYRLPIVQSTEQINASFVHEDKSDG